MLQIYICAKVNLESIVREEHVNGLKTGSADIANMNIPHMPKGAFTLGNFARDFTLSLHVLLKKIYFITKRASLV